jgi:hypothetical protein
VRTYPACTQPCGAEAATAEAQSFGGGADRHRLEADGPGGDVDGPHVAAGGAGGLDSRLVRQAAERHVRRVLDHRPLWVEHEKERVGGLRGPLVPLVRAAGRRLASEALRFRRRRLVEGMIDAVVEGPQPENRECRAEEDDEGAHQEQRGHRETASRRGEERVGRRPRRRPSAVHRLPRSV